VEEVVKDGPAYLSGKVQTSDIVKAVDSVRVGRRHGYALDNVKKLILGLPDTAVTLRIIRSQKEFDVIITRAPPRMSSAVRPQVGVQGSMVSGAGSPLSASHAPGSHPLMQRSNSMPVQPKASTEQDVRFSGGNYAVHLEYQVTSLAIAIAFTVSCALSNRDCTVPVNILPSSNGTLPVASLFGSSLLAGILQT